MIKNFLIGTSFVLSIVALVLVFVRKEKELVYVDTGKLFAEFDLSKELNKGLDETLKARKNIVDSLYQKVRMLTIEVKAEVGKNSEKVRYLAGLEEEYYFKKQQFEQDNKSATENYLSKVWNQLNQYITDYGKLKNYSLILGANGQGNIMYGEEGKNVTEEILKYVNDRYADKIKK